MSSTVLADVADTCKELEWKLHESRSLSISFNETIVFGMASGT